MRKIHEYMILEVTYFISSRKRSLRVFHGPTESIFHSFLFCSLAQLATKMELDNNRILRMMEKICNVIYNLKSKLQSSFISINLNHLRQLREFFLLYLQRFVE